MTKPTDTSQTDPMFLLALAMGDQATGRGPSHFIEEQEAAGQAELVNSTSLPTKVNAGYRMREAERDAIVAKHGEGNWSAAQKEICRINSERTEEAFRKMGIVFSKPDKSDPLFREARLPMGWKRRGSDHEMWSYVDDEQGRERLSVFYKASFYDRDAFINITPRFWVDCDYDDWDKETEEQLCFGVVKDGGKEIFRSDPIPYRPYATAAEEARKTARAWAHENLPEGWDDLIEGWEV